MTYNLFIAYDLNRHEKTADYERLTQGIKDLGVHTRAQYSLWYVSSEYSAKQALEHLQKFVDENDSLAVVEAVTLAGRHLMGSSSTTIETHWARDS